MFFIRFAVTALSFGATALAAPVSVAGVSLPVDGLVSGGSLPIDTSKLPLPSTDGLPLPIVGGSVPSLESGLGGVGLPLGRRQIPTFPVDGLVPGGLSLPIDPSKLPLPSTDGLPLPVDVVGGAVPSLESGLGGIGLPLGRREIPTFPVALDNLGSVAGAVLNSINGAQALDAPSLLSSLGDLNGALEMVSSVLGPLQGMGVDSLLAGASMDEVTKKAQSVFPLVNQVTSKVQSMGLTSAAKGKLSTTATTLNGISSGLGMAPEVQSVVKGSLSKVVGSVGGVLGGLGINL